MEVIAERIIMLVLTVIASALAILVTLIAAMKAGQVFFQDSEPIPPELHPAVKLRREAATARRIQIAESPDIYEETAFTGTEVEPGSFEWGNWSEKPASNG